MTKFSRRQFLKRSTLASGAIALGASTWSQPSGSNGDIRIAIIGLNGRGKDHITEFSRIKGARIVALCDCDQEVLNRAGRLFEQNKIKVDLYRDIRRLLDDKNIDAISIATPNHWHSLAGIWGCQAGKDVYVEKPVSHSVWEGRKLVEAARKYERIVQAGLQSRSNHGFKEAFEWMRKGEIGKIQVARGLCYKRRTSIGKVKRDQPLPASVDYDLWCGPAPKLPLHRQRLHYDWHWVWPTGNGDLGNQGVHQMDLIRWATGKDTLSPKVMSIGGRLGYDDDGETPNTQMVVHDYGDMLLIFEVRGLPEKAGSETMDQYRGESIGIVIECEGGYLAGSKAYDKDGKFIREFSGEENHFENFIKAVRSRKKEDLNADILEGHLSSALCHTGNISYRLGSEKSSDAIMEEIKSSSAAQETFERMKEHLLKNKVDLESTPLSLGAFLEMDPAIEEFKDYQAANALLTRKYRKPYVVPNSV